MRKIPTLFARNHETDHLVRDAVVPGCEWVLAGEGRATRKFDGTAVRVLQGHVWKRYEKKPNRPTPARFEPAQDQDVVTGEQPGWIPVTGGPEDKWVLLAVESCLYIDGTVTLPDGTYELCGPKINGNPEHFAAHRLVPHGGEELEDCPRDYDGIKSYLAGHAIEGIVWWQRDGSGRMAKIKTKDFFSRRDVPVPG